MTLTGTHTELATVIQTLLYTPDTGRLGNDTLTIKAEDDTALSATKNTILNVSGGSGSGGGWTRWALNPDNPIVYEHDPIDLGAVIPFTPIVAVTGVGSQLIEEAHSDDDVTYTNFQLLQGQVIARYIKIRVTMDDAFAQLFDVKITINAETISEDLSDIDTSTLIGTPGDRRLALAKTYALITSVAPILQNVGSGWTVNVLDRDPVLDHGLKSITMQPH